jgi:hypothetical protein
MISSPERVRTAVSSPAGTFRAAAKLCLLQWAPFVAVVVLEPWAAVVTPLQMLIRHLRMPGSNLGTGPSAYESSIFEHSPISAAATGLLGVCALIIVALKITDENAKTWSDEAAWIAAVFMLASIVLSRMGISNPSHGPWQYSVACWSYLAGLAVLLFSLSLAVWLL